MGGILLASAIPALVFAFACSSVIVIIAIAAIACVLYPSWCFHIHTLLPSRCILPSSGVHLSCGWILSGGGHSCTLVQVCEPVIVAISIAAIVCFVFYLSCLHIHALLPSRCISSSPSMTASLSRLVDMSPSRMSTLNHNVTGICGTKIK